MADDADIVLIDHIGLALWRAAEAWKATYMERMADNGYEWFLGAGAAVLPHIGPNGARPADIARKLGVSRQAVQQLLDALEKDRVIDRHPDPEDRRARIVRFTPLGAAAHRAGNRVKQTLEGEFEEILGRDRLDRLRQDLEDARAFFEKERLENEGA
ncbi:MAG: MarR family transcriptional regulator [Pseudomonadota bacterium]